MPLVNVKAHLSEVVSRATRHHERTTITVHGRPAAVIASVEDIDALEETLDILSTPELIEALKESNDDLRAGRLHDNAEIEDVIKARKQS